MEIEVIYISKPIIHAIFVLFLLFPNANLAFAATAEICEALKPKSGADLSNQQKIQVDGKVSGLLGRLAQLNGDVEVIWNEEFSDRLPEYEDSSSLYAFERILYLRCVLLTASSYSDDEISREFDKLLKFWAQIGERQGAASAPAQQCVPPGMLPESGEEQAYALNNEGVRAEEDGDFERALLCFRQATTRNPDELYYLNASHISERMDNWNDAEFFAGKAIKHNKSIFRELEMTGRSHCSRRVVSKIGIPSVKSWERLMDVRIRRGDLSGAIVVMSDLLNTWPKKSCVKEQALRIAFRERARMHCANGQFPEAANDINNALKYISYSRKSALEEQAWLGEMGYYTGPIDGSFGPASKAALVDWFADGCPGDGSKVNTIRKIVEQAKQYKEQKN